MSSSHYPFTIFSWYDKYLEKIALGREQNKRSLLGISIISCYAKTPINIHLNRCESYVAIVFFFIKDKGNSVCSLYSM